MNSPPPRLRVDLRRLPRGVQYALALGVTALVVMVAWRDRDGAPAPAWMMDTLVPILSWLGLFLLVTGVVARLWAKRRGIPPPPTDS
ncbi:hypothetical protein LZ198_00235 [Myxococcus sp. K15C18031901]|uniref:hypothetical protein n=1 Tax=Myxococcus dinghuensis TaxID=2906761 RepID=UPI0020A738C8|nr:hypothetical protein [Myxococcus dinghuensis]MCP3097291.1 hypothetical protein [Myxococcus dinghuensis]